MILWDSRTIHGGLVGTGIMDPEQKATTLSRLSMVVCMTERKRASQEVLKSRIESFKKGTCTNHWPHEVHENSRGYSKLQNDSFRYTPIELTEEIKMLI